MIILTCSSSSEDSFYLLHARNGSIVRSYKTPQGFHCTANSVSLCSSLGFVCLHADKTLVNRYKWGQESCYLKSAVLEKMACLKLSSDGLYCVAGSQSGMLFLWKLSNGALLNCWNAHYKKVNVVVFGGVNDSSIISAGEDGIVHVWDLFQVVSEAQLKSKNTEFAITAKRTWSEHSLPVTALCVGVGGALLSASLDRTCKLFDTVTGDLVFSVLLPSQPTAAALDPVETCFFAGCASGLIHRIDIQHTISNSTSTSSNGNSSSGNSNHLVYKGHEASVTCVCVSEDGTLLVSGSDDRTVRSWDVLSGTLLHVFRRHAGSITNVIAVPLHFISDLVAAPSTTASAAAAIGKRTHALHHNNSNNNNNSSSSSNGHGSSSHYGRALTLAEFSAHIEKNKSAQGAEEEDWVLPRAAATSSSSSSSGGGGGGNQYDAFLLGLFDDFCTRVSA